MFTDSNVRSFPRSVSFAVHAFDDLSTAPFDTREYSRLKFGSDRVAKAFGYEMADLFNASYPELLDSPCVVIPAPSTAVPVASTLLSHHFMNRLNGYATKRGSKALEWSMIHRNMTYNNNYAHLPKEERKALLAADSIYINHEFVKDKVLLFIDDVRITGTHEEKIMTYLREQSIFNDHAFVCYGEYQGEDASIEGRLNHVEIKDAHDLVTLSHENGHRMTTRAVRLLLEASEGTIDSLLSRSPRSFIEDAYYSAIAKGYDTHEPYRDNFNRLSVLMNTD